MGLNTSIIINELSFSYNIWVIHMDKRLFKYSLIGFVFVSVFGSLLHFVFEWSGYNRAVALFAPVNESTWEHLKLLFFPYLIWTFIQYFLLKCEKGVFASKLFGAIAGMLTITVIFYTYIGASGKSIEILNILLFFIGVFAAFTTDYIVFKSGKFSTLIYDNISVAILTAISAVFFIFTFAPPLIPLFKDPVNSSYGL